MTAMCAVAVMRAIALAGAVSLATACGAPSAPARKVVAVIRPAGTWQGQGSRTIGFVSESGRFRVTWETRNERPSGEGIFRLTVHSAVSGRPIQLIADQKGVGSGIVNVEDDPRQYNFMVESANVEWSFSVDELLATYANEPK